jgi:hypothetical protein
MSNSRKPWWMYRHLRPLYRLLLQGYGLRRPYVAPVLPSILMGIFGVVHGPRFPGGTFPGGRIAVALSFAIGMYVMLMLTFLARRDAAKQTQDR